MRGWNLPPGMPEGWGEGGGLHRLGLGRGPQNPTPLRPLPSRLAMPCADLITRCCNELLGVRKLVPVWDDSEDLWCCPWPGESSPWRSPRHSGLPRTLYSNELVPCEGQVARCTCTL